MHYLVYLWWEFGSVASKDQTNGWRVRLNTDNSRAGNIGDHAPDSGLESVEEGIAHCSRPKEAFVGMVTVQRCAKPRSPNSHCVLAFVEVMVVEAFHPGVPDEFGFELHEGPDIQLDGVYNLDLSSLERIAFEEEMHHPRQLST